MVSAHKDNLLDVVAHVRASRRLVRQGQLALAISRLIWANRLHAWTLADCTHSDREALRRAERLRVPLNRAYALVLQAVDRQMHPTREPLRW